MDSFERLRLSVGARRALPSPASRRALREQAGASRESVAAAVGVTPGAVYFWEKGLRSPKGENLLRYVEVLALLRDGPKRDDPSEMREPDLWPGPDSRGATREE